MPSSRSLAALHCLAHARAAHTLSRGIAQRDPNSYITSTEVGANAFKWLQRGSCKRAVIRPYAVLDSPASLTTLQARAQFARLPLALGSQGPPSPKHQNSTQDAPTPQKSLGSSSCKPKTCSGSLATLHCAHTQRTPVRRILGCRGPPGQQEKGLPPNVHVLLCKGAYTQKITLKQKQQIAHSHPHQDLLPDQVPGCSSNQCLREYQSQPGGSQHTSRRFASEGIVPTGKLGLEIRQTFSLKGLLLGSSISLLFQAAGLWLQLQSRLMHSVHPDGLPQHMWAGFRPAEPSPGPHLHSPQGGGAPSSTPTPPHTQAADAN